MGSLVCIFTAVCEVYVAVTGVPRRQPRRRSGLATRPLWEPSPSHPILV